MKKFLFMIAAVAMMVSCTGNANTSGSASAASGEQAKADGATYEFKLANGITGTTGSKNCHLVELEGDFTFECVENGDNVDVTAKVTVTHDEDTEMDENPREGAELWISGRDDDNEDVKVTLKADDESYKALQEFFPKAAGEKVELTFKGTAPKADLEKLNGKECTNTLVI